MDYRSIASVPDDDQKALRWVEEGAAIPQTQVKTQENLVKLHKRGRMLVASYEAIRYQKLDLFSVTLRLLPSTGMYTSGDYTFSSLIQHLILPAIAAGAMTLGIMTRMVRSSVSEMRSRSFVTTLRAKGLSEPAIMRHVLRNSFPTLLTVAGLQFGYLMGGSTMVETIFSWPGISLIIYQSIFTSDFPVTQAAILIVAAIFVSINLLIDLLRIVADPRLRK